MKNGNLYLVGTVHTDLDGKERLDTLLNKLSPSVVALEFHKDREDLYTLQKPPEELEREVNAMIDELDLNLTPKQRATLMESGYKISEAMYYELKSSTDYTARNKNSRLEYIDLSFFVNGKEEFVTGCFGATRIALKMASEEPEFMKQLLERLDCGVDACLQYSRESDQQMYQNAGMVAELIEMVRDPETFELMKEHMPPQAIQALKQIYNPERDESMSSRIRELYDRKHRLVAIVGLGHLYGLKTRVEDLKPKVMTLAEYNSV